MTRPLDELRQDLEAEQAALDALVAGLTAAEWATPTPSPGWAVRDQIAHLAQFDDVAAVAMADPEGFAREVAAAATSSN
ncbi:MAG: maleylpyruvate isomerase N-terminal domain-containing protein, partial [Candidatus Rokubacteria bacterium]|nr:maleylpyruvate isomerase N-terminal domain-containing protein [Candidatus Rokubacteria bacterium]